MRQLINLMTRGSAATFEFKRVEAKFHGDAHARVADRPSSVKREAALHSCVNAVVLRQRYRRENVYFQSTFAAVAEGTRHVIRCTCVHRLQFRNASHPARNRRMENNTRTDSTVKVTRCDGLADRYAGDY